MNGVQYWPFPSTSATFYRPAELQSVPAGPSGPQPKRHDPLRTQSPILLARNTPSPQASGASDVEVLATANTKTTGLRKKRTNFLRRGPQNSVSCEELHKEKKIKIWNDIYSLYKERCPESQRTLQQVKKRQQNLDNEYKQLKQRTRSTGEAGIKKIKEGFPYFDVFDEVMGHRDSVDPSKMAIEGSSTFTSEPSVNDASQNESIDVSLEESEPPDDVTEVQKSGEKRRRKQISRRKVGAKAKEGGEMFRKVRLKTGRVLLWKCGNGVWNRTTQDLNVRRKCSVTPRAGKWNKQTPYLLASKTFSKI